MQFKNMATRVLAVFCATFFAVSSLLAQENVVPGQLIVQIDGETSIQKVMEDLKEVDGQYTGLRYMKTLSLHMRAYLISFDERLDADDILYQVGKHQNVQLAQYNHKVQLRETEPNDPAFGEQWQHINSGATAAWDVTTGGATAVGDDIVVCVIEGGNNQHDDIAPNAWVNEGEIEDNGIDDDENGFVDDYLGWDVSSQSDNGVLQGGHGTNVMGMIGAKGNNDLGVSGINWDVKIMSVSGENIGNEASVIEAYNYPLEMRKLYEETNGAKGAFVVSTNASWGIDQGDPATIPIWCNFYDTLGVHGILNCGATTNQALDVDAVGDIPTACGSDYMISVTATDINDSRNFSGFGQTTIDLGAPGDNIYTTNGQNTYGNTSGTSFASPYTAGAIALLYSAPCSGIGALAHQDPQAAADLVRQVLFDGVDQTEQLLTESVTGGRINVFNSLQLLLAQCADDACFAPFNTSTSSEDGVDFVASWTSFVDDATFDLRYRAMGSTDWIMAEGLAQGSYSFEGLEWCTTYEYQIKSNCGELGSEFSESFTYATDGCCTAILSDQIISEREENAILLEWPAILAAESWTITYSSLGDPDTETISGITGNSTTIDGLLGCTEYEISIQTDCADENVPSETFVIKTRGCGACEDEQYCAVAIEDTADEFITYVGIASYANESGDDDGYGDFTGTPWELNRLQEYEITVRPGFEGNSFAERIKVWVDLNQNGEFEEGAELFIDQPLPNDEFILDGFTLPFTLPLEAQLGVTRMRVHIAWANEVGDDGQTPCEDLDYGEIEDYCLDILDGTAVEETISLQSAVYPNPMSGELTVVLGEQASFILYDSVGKIVANQTLRAGRNTVQVGALSPGLYTYSMRTLAGKTKNGTLIKK